MEPEKQLTSTGLNAKSANPEPLKDASAGISDDGSLPKITRGKSEKQQFTSFGNSPDMTRRNTEMAEFVTKISDQIALGREGVVTMVNSWSQGHKEKHWRHERTVLTFGPSSDPERLKDKIKNLCDNNPPLEAGGGTSFVASIYLPQRDPKSLQ